MFFLLRVIIVVAVLFCLSPARENRHGPGLDASAAGALTGGFWPLAAGGWSAIPEPVRGRVAAEALDRLSRADVARPERAPQAR